MGGTHYGEVHFKIIKMARKALLHDTIICQSMPKQSLPDRNAALVYVCAQEKKEKKREKREMYFVFHSCIFIPSHTMPRCTRRQQPTESQGKRNFGIAIKTDCTSPIAPFALPAKLVCTGANEQPCPLPSPPLPSYASHKRSRPKKRQTKCWRSKSHSDPVTQHQ